MALSDDLKFKLIVAAAGVGVVLYASYRAKQAVSGALDSVGSAIGEGATFVANLPATAWNTMQTPQTQFGPANGVATDNVNAPSNLLDATSMGMISGAGGNTGSENLGSWLWGFVNGDAFRGTPSTDSAAPAQQVPDPLIGGPL